MKSKPNNMKPLSQNTVIPTLNSQNIDLGELLRAIVNDPNAHIEGCDVNIYLSMLDEIEASEADKKELIHTLWNVIETIILTQFRMDSATLAICQSNRMPTQSEASMIKSLSTPFHSENKQSPAFNDSVGMKERVE